MGPSLGLIGGLLPRVGGSLNAGPLPLRGASLGLFIGALSPDLTLSLDRSPSDGRALPLGSEPFRLLLGSALLESLEGCTG